MGGLVEFSFADFIICLEMKDFPSVLAVRRIGGRLWIEARSGDPLRRESDRCRVAGEQVGGDGTERGVDRTS
jgi:hypothetical protein